MESILKTTLRVVSIMLLVISSIYVNHMQTSRSAHDLLLLSNIEALADNEDDMDGTILCMGVGNVYCPVTKEKVEVVIKGYALGQITTR